MPGDNTNTAYIEKIGPKKTADFSFTMEARADAKAGPQKIDIAIAYEDSQAAQLTAADEISVEVHQKIRLEYDPPKFHRKSIWAIPPPRASIYTTREKTPFIM